MSCSQGCITGIYAWIRTHDLLITRCYYGCSSLCKLTSKSSPDFKTLLQLNCFFGPSHLPSLTKNLNLDPSLQVQAPGSFRCYSVAAVSIFLQLFEETMKKVLAEKNELSPDEQVFWDPKSLPCSCSCWDFNGPWPKALYL